ncbi:MAG: antibiotic biosynthesis monooxygenase [Candidatus Eremiobacteraeota bacterium]|nr:antibiotic biosynthesis monooxygenase [Candidatus Eremiobacteraeota bacterium]
MIYIIATTTAHEGNHTALVAAFRTILATVRAKRGCLRYDLAAHVKSGFPGQASFDENDLVIVEAWADRESFEEHITDSAYRAWFVGVYPLIAKASMLVLEDVS